jgi:flagellar basal body-associated protein FliL
MSDDTATIIIIVVVLVVIAGLGVGAFIWYKKRNSPDSDARQVYKQVADKNESD